MTGADELQRIEEAHVTKSSEPSSTSTHTLPSKPSSEVPTKTTTSDKPVVARPKEPPPPLPKTPPKGAAHQKTPPPLPRHPPKGQGGAKATSQSLKSLADKSLVQKVENIHTHINGNKAGSQEDVTKESKTINQNNPVDSEHKSHVLPPVKPKPRRKTIDTVTVHDRQKEISGKNTDFISEDDLVDKTVEIREAQKSVLERELSVGNSTWFHTELDTSSELNDKNTSKDASEANLRSNTNEKSRGQNHVLERVTSVGNSIWFVEPDGGEKEAPKNETTDEESQNDKVKPGSEQKVTESSSLGKIGASAIPAPNGTPPPVPKKLVHKPPPPVPSNVKPLEPYISDTNSATSNDKSFSCDTHKTEKCECEEGKEDFSAKISKVESAIKESLINRQPKPKPRASISSAKSVERLPLVVPRKPIPPAKLLPTPKKRSSINRLSGSENFIQNQTLTGSLENLPTSSEEGLKDIEGDHKTEERVFVKTSKPDNAIAAYTKSKVASSQNEEKQYRVIDKSVLGTSNQKTEVCDNARKDNKNNLPQNIDDSNVNISVVELRKKFKENKNPQIDVPKSDNDAHNVSDNKDDSKSSSDHTPSSLKGSFDDLLSDKSILEPSSLLNEIEEILSRSYKHSSLTRSGSSPEKRAGIALYRDTIDVKSERSLSLDLSPEQKTSTPIRPPRPKKEAKRLRSQSQIIYDTCASDTESLPDLSATREEELQSLKDDLSKTFTLGPAKPHPPKPKRNKLLKVQRSHSDVTKMKSFLDQKEMAENKISPRFKQGAAVSNENINNNSTSGQVGTVRAKRPSRKAPPPPSKLTSQTSVDLNVVVPVDSRVKSMNMEKRLSQKSDLEDTAGSIYDSIKDVEVPYSSDEDHDYHEIPEHLRQRAGENDSRSKSGSPPKLPPRNYSNSNSFDSSSQSGFVCDISVDTVSSVEDLSVSSAVLKTESGSTTNSPLVKKRQISKPLPSPLLPRKLEEVQNLDSFGLSGSNLSIPESLPDSTGSRTRPVSNASEMTVTSSESEGEDEEIKVKANCTCTKIKSEKFRHPIKLLK